MAWATVEETEELTGKVLSGAQIAQAQAILDLVVNRTEAASGRMRGSDRIWLKRATAYQAAFMDDHPEVFSQMEVERHDQEGLSITFRDRDSLYLAPLARKALQRLSWMGTRSLRVTSDFERASVGGGSWKQLPSDWYR